MQKTIKSQKTINSTKTANAKKANATTKKATTNKKSSSKNLKSINLQKFKKELESKVVENVKKDKQTLYNYPTEWNKEIINSLKGKKFRQNARTKLKRFSDNIFFYAKSEDLENLKKQIKDFKIWYKETFIINDYNASSLTTVTKKHDDINLMLNIIKEVETK